MSQARLHTEIVALSKADNWEAAVTEWRLEHVHMSETPDTCLCGHYPIMEICTIKNRENGAETEVGNSCVNNFMGLGSENLFASLRKVKVDAGASLNPDVIEWAFERRIITTWEHDFYLDIWRKRNLTPRQREFKLKINAKVMAKVTR